MAAAMQRWIVQGAASNNLPTIHVVSDSTGTTAKTLAQAASASFGVINPYLEILPGIKSARELTEELESHYAYHCENNIAGAFILFYTLVDQDLRKAMNAFVVNAQKKTTGKDQRVIAVDVLDKAHAALSEATGRTPVPNPGALFSMNEEYFKRLGAIDFTINHDDGRNPQDLSKAEIVLIGVSRSSKTPLSIYLAQLGFKVANVPLDGQTDPPKELFDVDPARVFGLMTDAKLLSQIRRKRITGKAASVAASYSELEAVYKELKTAHALMRKIGCIVIRTDNRAIEETAQEILRYYENAHPQF